MTDYLKGLNDRQKNAVLHSRGPLLVLAGAGSGKTRVLTARIARLIAEKICKPEQILAVTFTNKAAREMKERIAALVTKKAAEAMTVSTFHSLGARILRQDGKLLGLAAHFSIMGDYDRLSSIRAIMRTCGKSMQEESHERFATLISLAKNAGINPADYAANDENLRKAAKVYRQYASAALKRQCVDFDDLLLLPLRLFERFPEVLEKYRRIFTFISIDEFQDTNAVQMRLAALLAAPRNNLMVVGDDDQSIYSWRGAVVDNILDFSSKFKGCTTVILDKNYRSTRQILDGAHAVVEKNPRRTAKKIVAMHGDGDPIMHYRGDDEEEEADWIAAAIRSNVELREFHLRDHALLLRANAQMRQFEEALRRARLPYRTVGAASFFERKEVRDVLAYLRFFANTEDELSFVRMLKVPEKHIDAATLRELDDHAAARGITVWKAVQHADGLTLVAPQQRQKLAAFAAFCRTYQERFQKGHASAALRDLLTECDYLPALEKSGKEPDGSNPRMENVEEIIRGLALYERKHPRAGLTGYLQDLSLMADDDTGDSRDKNAVTLMTMHKAKGLEFPAVFLANLDDAIVPSPRTIEEGRIDEERRLFYVGMTRAKRRLYLTWPRTKLFRNKNVEVNACRFIYEIPEEFLERPFGQQEEKDYNEFRDGFFRDMREKLGADGAQNPMDTLKKAEI